MEGAAEIAGIEREGGGGGTFEFGLSVSGKLKRR